MFAVLYSCFSFQPLIFCRDDLTVQVIFFGNGAKTGEVTINLDATAETAEPKPKL